MTTLYAQPYDISVTGFYFESLDEYNKKSSESRNEYGQVVEEYEIQFIEGEAINGDLFKAIGIHQGSIGAYLNACEAWEEYQKINVIIAVGDAGYIFDFNKNNPDDFDVELYEMDSLREFAFHFVDEGLLGDIPDNILCYLDYDAIARDLGMDYSEIVIDGRSFVYRCG